MQNFSSLLLDGPCILYQKADHDNCPHWKRKIEPLGVCGSAHENEDQEGKKKCLRGPRSEPIEYAYTGCQ